MDSATDRLNADELSLLRAAQRNVEWLQLLIDDLLTYNEIEAGTLQIERAHVCLKQVVDAALIAVGPMLRQRCQTASAQVSSALECCGDRRRLEQLLVNLLANACVH